MPVNRSSKSYKHQDLYEYMMGRIRDGVYQPGELIDSEQALALRLGLSRNTVRQTFARLEQDGFIERRQGKGTFLKENAEKMSRKIAMIVTDLEQIGNPVTVNLVRGLRNVFNQEGYTLELLTFPNTIKETGGRFAFSEDDLIRLNKNYCGILLGAILIDKKCLDILQHGPRPFFFIKNYPDECADMAMKINYTKAGYLAAEHLISQQRSNLALVGASERFTIGKNFISGVKSACLEYGARLSHDNIFLCGYNNMEAAKAAVNTMLQNPHRPDGIVAACDEIALCVMRELKNAGINIPANISIIGCNDIDVAALTSPSLSSIHLPMTRLGEQSAGIMMKMLKGEKYSFPELEPELRIRESSQVL